MKAFENNSENFKLNIYCKLSFMWTYYSFGIAICMQGGKQNKLNFQQWLFIVPINQTLTLHKISKSTS